MYQVGHWNWQCAVEVKSTGSKSDNLRFPKRI